MERQPSTGPPAMTRARWQPATRVSARYAAASDRRRERMHAATEEAFARLYRDQERDRRGEAALSRLVDAVAYVLSPAESQGITPHKTIHQ